MHGVLRALAALIAALSVLAAGLGPARADDKKEAKALFRKGLGHMLTGKLDQGCPALQQSYDLDPMPGTLFTLAECEAKRGHTADALRHYKEYLSVYVKMTLEQREKKKQKHRYEVSNTQVNALSGLVSYITITLATNAPVETVVKLDQRVLQQTELGTPIPIEPGAHRVVVEAPGSEPNEHTTTVAKGDKVVLMVGKGGRVAPPKEVAPEEKKPQPAAGGDADEGTGGAQRASAYVIGGLGLAGLIAGTGTGIAAIDERNTAYESCLDTLCTADGKRAAESAQALGNASTATFVIGAAAIGTAIILLATAPDGKKIKDTARWLPSVSAAVDGSGAAVGISGSW